MNAVNSRAPAQFFRSARQYPWLRTPSMQDQKKLLVSAERAIKRLAKLAFHISEEKLANWMIEGDKLGECRAADITCVAEWLTDVPGRLKVISEEL